METRFKEADVENIQDDIRYAVSDYSTRDH